MIAGIVASFSGASAPADTDPHWASTTTLMHFDGVNNSTTMTDVKGATWRQYGGAKLSTTQKKFGASSVRFNGASYVYCAAPKEGYSITDNPFTLEMNLYLDDDGLDHGVFFMATGTGLTVGTVGGNIRVGSRNSIPDVVTSSVPFPRAAFTHLAIVRTALGGEVRIYQGGVLVGSSAPGDISFGLGQVEIGAYQNDGLYLRGYVDEYRFTAGVGRYTANFTPPVAPFPNS